MSEDEWDNTNEDSGFDDANDAGWGWHTEDPVSSVLNVASLGDDDAGEDGDVGWGVAGIWLLLPPLRDC